MTLGNQGRGQGCCIVSARNWRAVTDPDVFHCGTISTLYVLPDGKSLCCSSAYGGAATLTAGERMP